MKIQLKRSSVLDGGTAKEPTADQMEYGELAVNYSDTDPAIFLKDSANNIIRISGVGNISDDGQVEVPGSVNPPVNPSEGNLWYNAEDGRLYVYYNDGNSSQWVDASPDNWQGANTVPDLDDSNQQPGTLDDRYVNKFGDDMTGNLTLGTNKITLNATDGSAKFSGGGVEISRTGTVSVRNYYNEVVDNSFPCFAGRNYSGATTSQIFGDGSATFVSDVNIGARNPASNTAAGIRLTVEGGATGVYAQASDGVITATNAFQALKGTTEVFSVDYSGAADFAGQVTAGETTRAIGTSGANLGPDGYVSVVHSSRGESDCFSIYDSLAGQEKFTCRIKGNGSATFSGGAIDVSSSGTISVRNYYNASPDDSFPCFAGRNFSGSTTSQIFGDGSGVFAGSIRAGNDTFTGPGTAISPSGNIYIQGAANDTSVAFSVVNSTAFANPVAQILHDGSAVFGAVPDAALSNLGTSISGAGTILTRVGSDTDESFRAQVAGSGDASVRFYGDGSAEFNGTITAGGFDLTQLPQL